MKSLYPLLYLKPEKGTPFGRNLPVSAIIGVPPTPDWPQAVAVTLERPFYPIYSPVSSQFIVFRFFRFFCRTARRTVLAVTLRTFSRMIHSLKKTLNGDKLECVFLVVAENFIRSLLCWCVGIVWCLFNLLYYVIW